MKNSGAESLCNLSTVNKLRFKPRSSLPKLIFFPLFYVPKPPLPPKPKKQTRVVTIDGAGGDTGKGEDSFSREAHGTVLIPWMLRD